MLMMLKLRLLIDLILGILLLFKMDRIALKSIFIERIRQLRFLIAVNNTAINTFIRKIQDLIRNLVKMVEVQITFLDKI